MRRSIGEELSSDIVSETGELLDDFMVILEMAGENYYQLKNKLKEVFQLDDVTVNWKLVGGQSSQIIT